MSNLAVAPGANLAAGPFSHASYLIKRPFWSFFGRKFHVYAPDGSLAMFVRHPILKLKQEFTIFHDEGETQALLHIRQRKLLTLNAAYDIVDAPTGQKLGAIRSRGLKSILRDTWDILDANDQVVGLAQEDSLAILRRLFPFLMGRWHLEMGGQQVGAIRQIFAFFTKQFSLDISEAQGRIDPRFAMACALLALMAEIHRQEEAR
ncbi:MAG TPA: hypothetical protein VGM56_05365 [Byssovorax sp.]|jgi:uncharacterized protein YxjI